MRRWYCILVQKTLNWSNGYWCQYGHEYDKRRTCVALFTRGQITLGIALAFVYDQYGWLRTETSYALPAGTFWVDGNEHIAKWRNFFIGNLVRMHSILDISFLVFLNHRHTRLGLSTLLARRWWFYEQMRFNTGVLVLRSAFRLILLFLVQAVIRTKLFKESYARVRSRNSYVDLYSDVFGVVFGIKEYG